MVTPTPRRRKKVVSSSHRKSSKKNGRLFFHHWPGWTIWLGIVLFATLYIGICYYFFVGPTSFRWKAVYGETYYPEGYEVHGIDVSHYQENIRWEELRNASIDNMPVRFVFIKATEGISLFDSHFNQNFYEAKQNDIIRGAYHYFTPDVPAHLQAEFFLRQVHLEPGDLPPVLDVEDAGSLTKAQLTQSVKIWLDIVEKKYGVKPIIYSGFRFKQKYLSDIVFDDYPYWIAHYYVEKITYQGQWHFWQHTDCGKVVGIKGKVDCNVFNGSVADLLKLTLPAENPVTI